MEIKCNYNPYFKNYRNPHISAVPVFNGLAPERVKASAGLCADKFVKRPVAGKSATGLFGLVNAVKNYGKNYVDNIKHTYDHKVVFALIEKELFGKNSIDSVTHDLDKMVLYCLGLPKSFVSKVHRKHSEHHSESGKVMNLRSMLCDNIASSPEFKPEKKLSLREHFNHSKELQNIDGFAAILEKFNFGENIDFAKIKNEKMLRASGFVGILSTVAKAFYLIV